VNESCPIAGNGSPPPGRRGFFHTCIALLGAISSVAVVYPIVAFLRLPRRASAGDTLEVAEAELREGEALYREHAGEQVILIKLGEEIEVFNASCTHLGCLVTWDPVARLFRCPCHGAAFDAEGKPAHGPVNIPLHRMEFERKGGKVVLS